MQKNATSVEAPKIGRAVRQLRIDRGLTQEQLSQRTGLREATVCRLERGASANVRTLERIAVALGITLAQLMNLSEDLHAQRQSA